MNPEEILAHATVAYERVPSYQDRGVVLSHWQAHDEPHEILFQTWFIRPQHFRFDWRDHHPFPPLRHVVWNHSVRCAGAMATYWHDDPPQEETTTLRLAIAGATGISRGAAYDVPNLLMPGVVGGFQLDQLLRPVYERNELFEGTHCHVVGGDHPRGGPMRIWIGQADWFIRKIWNEFGAGNASEQIHRDIAVNGVIDPGVFGAGGSLLGGGIG